MIGITRAGEIITGESFAGIELVAVILTKADDKPEVVDCLRMNVFPRLIGEVQHETQCQAEDL